MSRYWCGVVSKEHIMRGVAGGFCQVCHGKRGPLERMSLGDGIIFYSPVTKFKSDEKCQKFTAIGRVVGDSAYQFEMAPDFIPYRRDVEYYSGTIDVPIHPMLNRLSFTRGVKSWGYPFRRGHFEITDADFVLISQSMMPDNWRNACAGMAAEHFVSKGVVDNIDLAHP